MKNLRIGCLFAFTVLTTGFALADNPACQQANSDVQSTWVHMSHLDVHNAGTCAAAAVNNAGNCLSGNTQVDNSCPAYEAPTSDSGAGRE